ncbi:birA, biotin-(acetyl-CoA-carboxylase) ligase [Desulfocurvibacter africanus PCS]|uniref:biotin--[biotin carboxyl-carrier protein] ligase n=1 Tax=Desulfocurvibacter africanus PCS TaxID=1262666 RepID=M5Q2T0_DESAF|nr:biotin--[acetyl-CoA-carboxylase] ligase [Desulfocurvibacter africanus]EMG38736.1 birA, biotin-(acetyl-CoA-carboxylase) ligase [Desulfocurvibacter africanus PCS]
MIEKGIHILADELEPGAAVTPDDLSRAHPLWGLDVQSLAPWVHRRQSFGGEHLDCWTSEAVEIAWPVLVSGPCGSSMDLAWRLVAQNALPPWSSILAVSQQCGRGQTRRHWNSPSGNLYAAWLWPRLPEQWTRLASLLAGYILCKALQVYVPDLRMKWPNDLLHGDAKVGGVLVEERKDLLLVGFGLNLSSAPSQQDMRAGAVAPAGHLSSLGQDFGILGLWLRLITAAYGELERIQAGELGQFLRSMEELLAWRGSRVRIRETGEGERLGILIGLSEDGGLRLAEDAGEQVLYSGTIIPL